ncbi:MAG: hypothetical protein KJ697_04090 [Nanoarchaeota archaeon]|nr:hypothetical protein [Nanoarchaeota archaeon]
MGMAMLIGGDNIKTSFLEVMGDSPINKVIDFLIENDRESWSMIEICKNANVGYSTLKLILPQLLKYDLIIIKKTVGKINFYQINKESIIVKRIYSLYEETNVCMMENFK